MEKEAKFRKDAKINWYRSKIDKKLMSELMKPSDFRGFLQVSLQLGLFVVTGTLAYLAYQNIHADNWWWSVPLLLATLFIHGTFSPFMGLVAIHELVHKTPFKTKFWNEFFLRFYSFISWSDYLWFRPSHVKHHQVTVHNGYDGEVVLPQKLSLKDWKFWLGLIAWNPFDFWGVLKKHYRRANGRVDNDWYEYILPEEDEALRRSHRRWAQFVLIGHIVLATTFILAGHWFLIVVFTLGTTYCNWLIFLCGTPQHFGLSPNVNDFRLCCRTYTCSWLPGFLYWNMQYHIEHHMFPAVPFFNLPKLRQALLHDLPPAHHGLLATWKEILEIHKKQIADPQYTFVPTLPKSADAGTRASDNILEREAALSL